MQFWRKAAWALFTFHQIKRRNKSAQKYIEDPTQPPVVHWQEAITEQG